MATIADSGTVTTSGAEQTLATLTSPGTYVLIADLSSMANGDEIVIKIKTKVLSSGTTGVIYRGFYSHSQAVPIKSSIPVPSDEELIVTLEQEAGSGLSISWKVMNLEG